MFYFHILICCFSRTCLSESPDHNYIIRHLMVLQGTLLPRELLNSPDMMKAFHVYSKHTNTHKQAHAHTHLFSLAQESCPTLHQVSVETVPIACFGQEAIC